MCQADYYYPLNTNSVTFEECKYNAPNRTTEVLINRYGEYMVLPSSVAPIHSSEFADFGIDDIKLLSQYINNKSFKRVKW